MSSVRIHNIHIKAPHKTLVGILAAKIADNYFHFLHAQHINNTSCTPTTKALATTLIYYHHMNNLKRIMNRSLIFLSTYTVLIIFGGVTLK